MGLGYIQAEFTCSVGGSHVVLVRTKALLVLRETLYSLVILVRELRNTAAFMFPFLRQHHK